MKKIIAISLLCFSVGAMATPEKVCMCTKQWDPVCGKDGKTYGNVCEARCAKVEVIKTGECEKNEQK